MTLPWIEQVLANVKTQKEDLIWNYLKSKNKDEPHAQTLTVEICGIINLNFF